MCIRTENYSQMPKAIRMLDTIRKRLQIVLILTHNRVFPAIQILVTVVIYNPDT